MTLAEYLRTNTRHLHDQAEERFSSIKIFERDFTLDDYRQLIIGNYKLVCTYENAVFSVLSQYPDLKLDLERRRKLPKLLGEMQQLGISAENVPVMPHPTTVYEAIGILYVMEGSTLGGNVIAKNLRRNERFRNTEFHYFGMYGDATGGLWKSFLIEAEKFVSTIHFPEVLKGASLAYSTLLNTQPEGAATI